MTPTVMVAGAVVMGWESDPSNRHQLTHAVRVGHTVAECGMKTTVRGAVWPQDATHWPGPLGRCPLCARIVYLD